MEVLLLPSVQLCGLHVISSQNSTECGVHIRKHLFVESRVDAATSVSGSVIPATFYALSHGNIVFERITKELAASAPSAMKTKVASQQTTSSLLAPDTCYAEVSFQPCVQHLRRVHPQVFVRQCRVVKRQVYGPGGLERMTKASALSAVKIEVVTSPDNIALTVRPKTLLLRGSVDRLHC